jgi:benzoate membrane transport protein
MDTTNSSQSWLVSVGTAIPMIILPLVILSIPVSVAARIGLSAEEFSSWILALYGVPAVAGIILSYRYKQPLLFTGNVFIMIFFASVGEDFSYTDFVGASILAGIIVTIVSLLGMVDRLSRVIPPPVVLGLLAGAVLPYVVDVFSMLDDAPLMIGGTVSAFLLSLRFLDSRVPAVLPALVAGALLAALSGNIGSLPETIPPPSIVLITPTASVESIVALTPVLVMLLTVQANVPSIVFLRAEGYTPPERPLNTLSGVITSIVSLIGPTGVSLSLPATSLIAGSHAGARPYRHRAVYISSVGVVTLALFSGIAAELASILPLDLMLAIAGLAIIDMLVNALREVTSGPLTLGPIFAFTISLSDISLLGFGPFFWGLAVGAAVSMFLEGDAMRALRQESAVR